MSKNCLHIQSKRNVGNGFWGLHGELHTQQIDLFIWANAYYIRLHSPNAMPKTHYTITYSIQHVHDIRHGTTTTQKYLFTPLANFIHSFPLRSWELLCVFGTTILPQISLTLLAFLYLAFGHSLFGISFAKFANINRMTAPHWL